MVRANTGINLSHIYTVAFIPQVESLRDDIQKPNENSSSPLWKGSFKEVEIEENTFICLGKRSENPDEVRGSEPWGGVDLKVVGDKEEREIKQNCGSSTFEQVGKDHGFKSII